MLNIYNDILNKVTKDLGDGITYDDQIDKYCNSIKALKDYNFLGTHSQDFNIPPNNVNCCYIINTSPSYKPGQHWTAVVHENNNIYCYDSFGRSPSRLLPIFNNNVRGGVIYDDTQNQKKNEFNCGQRCISFLITASKIGIKNAIKI